MADEQLNREISIIYDLLFGYTDKMRNLRDELNPEEYKLPVQIALVLKINDYPLIVEGMSSFQKEELRRETSNILNRIAVKKFRDILSAPVEEDTFVLFFSLPAGGKEAQLNFAYTLKEKLEEETEFAFSIGLGRSYFNLKGLIFSYQEALNACKNARFLGEGIKHVDDNVIFKQDIPIFISEMENLLIEKIKQGETEDYEDLMREIVEAIIEERIEPDIVKMRMMNLFFKIIREIKKDQTGPGETLNTLFPYIEKLLEVHSKDELYRLTNDLIGRILTVLRDKKILNNSVEINRALTYIEDHYNQELSLNEVSEQVGLSLYYFSHLFKEEVGQTFISYLNKLRVDRAKKLLSETNLNISEIGYEVGYNDPNYFTRVFKEYEKTTPSRYRGNHNRTIL